MIFTFKYNIYNIIRLILFIQKKDNEILNNKNINNIPIKTIQISLTIKKEFFRKTIHMMAAFVPFFYYYSESMVMSLLILVTLIYFFSEVLRLKNIHIPVIYQITEIAARTKDEDNIMLGPITLAMGIFLSLIFFDYRVAVISIYALAFGDGVASLFGKLIGGWKIPFTFGKTFSGTLGCFFTLTIVYLACSLNLNQAIMLAVVASVIEAFPTGDYDNLLITVGTGLIATKYIL